MLPDKCRRVVCGAAEPFAAPHMPHLQAFPGVKKKKTVPKKSEAVHTVTACTTQNQSLLSPSLTLTVSQAPRGRIAKAETPGGPQARVMGSTQLLASASCIPPRATCHVPDHAWQGHSLGTSSSGTHCANTHSHSWGRAFRD